jgi:dUTP pyrophosphatase
MPTLKIKKLVANAELPKYMTKGAAGFDLASTSHKIIPPGETVLVGTGLAMAIPEGYEVQIRPRSGLSCNTLLRIPNSPGTIDSDYRGEVKVPLWNASDESILIFQGERIAQGVFKPVEQATIELVDELDETARGAGGFGHTGGN